MHKGTRQRLRAGVFLLVVAGSGWLALAGSRAGFAGLAAVAAGTGAAAAHHHVCKRGPGRARRRRLALIVALSTLGLAIVLTAAGSRRSGGALAPRVATLCGLFAASAAVGAWSGRRRQRVVDLPDGRFRFRESRLAHHLLDGLKGIEIGASAHNPFGLDTINLDLCASAAGNVYKQAEVSASGEYVRVDVVGRGESLPFLDESVDFVLASHVLEHFPDPIAALKEWRRVIRKNGRLFMIVPHKERTADRARPRTTLAELIERHRTGRAPTPPYEHYSVWITEDVVELVTHLGWRVEQVQDVDDKVGNGFTVVVRKE